MQNQNYSQNLSCKGVQEMSFLVFQFLQHRRKNTSKRWPANVEGSNLPYHHEFHSSAQIMNQLAKHLLRYFCVQSTFGGYRDVWGVPKEYVHWFYNLAGLMHWNESCPLKGTLCKYYVIQSWLRTSLDILLEVACTSWAHTDMCTSKSVS